MNIKILAVSTVTLLGLLVVPAATPLSSAAPATEGRVATAQPLKSKAAAKKPAKNRFHVAAGVTLTNPLDETRGRITNKIVAAINHTKSGEKIRAVSWNFASDRYVKAFTRAHNRGVSVRIIMARTLAEAQGGGGAYNSMRRNLREAGNKERPAALRSWIRTCDHSCRGAGGAMHAKYYIFSKAGQTEKVVMNTSANLTTSAATVQWNELFTVTERPVTYKNYMRVFNQMIADKKRRYTQYTDGTIVGFWFPKVSGRHLALQMLDKVKCKGAKGAGTKGRTVIRVAMDVFNNQIGAAIARRLLQLKNRGCNVKVVYSQAVGASKGPVKALNANHLVQDTDGDGAYDRYLHGKIMSISGNYDGNRGERIIINGSGNWSGTAVQSDEQGMIIDRDNVERKYTRWVNEMYDIHLVSAPRDPAYRRVKVDPYRNMES